MVPQAPQLLLSVVLSVQVPLQLANPDWQVRPQVPPEHTYPAGQTLEQVPQLPLSVLVSTQVPLQFISPDWQESEQVPPEQTWPAGQMVAQLPQWLRSLWRS